MSVAVISANLGAGLDKNPENVIQSVDFDLWLFTNENFPIRSRSMTPRLQARIPKMFGWQMVPGYDYYIWVDSSCVLSNYESVAWFLEQCKDVDIAVFKHPHRNTVQEEVDYLRERLELERTGRKQLYILPRYENELIDQQLEEIEPEAELFASTAFIYKNTPEVRDALKEWWYHTSRFHSIDQLSLPFAIRNLRVKVIPDNYLKSNYIEYVRNK